MYRWCTAYDVHSNHNMSIIGVSMDTEEALEDFKRLARSVNLANTTPKKRSHKRMRNYNNSYRR